ncbi:MAG TPA: PfkB family carbohydrate kinase [Gaiellaceae bacterium]|nr:PfkB family carbohydrate kinase [Gaiellaceae bacterium]
MRTAAASIAVVGEVMLDVLVAPGSEAHAAEVVVRAGGTVVNAALAAAAAGADTTAVGRVGRDAAAAAVGGALAGAGVADALATDERERTGTFVRVEETIHVDRGANRRLRPDDLRRLDADAVLVSGYALLHDDTRAAARAALTGAARLTAATGGSARLAQRGGRGAFDGVDVLVVDADEAFALTGAAPDEAARELSRTHDTACVTLGRDGAVLAAAGALHRHRLADELVLKQHKLIGAGDAFAAVLIVELARGTPPPDALAAACAAAARSG